MSWEKAIKLTALAVAAGVLSGIVVAKLKPHPLVAVGIAGGAQLVAFRYMGA